MGSKKHDGVALLSDGRIRLDLDGGSVTLRRPKIKELRAQYERLAEVDAAQQGVTDKWKQLELAERVAAYWRQAVETLGSGDTLPAEDDDLPVWLLSADLIVRVEKHWREVPYLSGGE